MFLGLLLLQPATVMGWQEESQEESQGDVQESAGQQESTDDVKATNEDKAQSDETEASEASAVDAWSIDAAASAESARKDSRDMLLLFTGSDWCPPCIKLESQILGKQEFLKAASKEYVLVKFDFPEKTEQSAELEEQNVDWATRFGIEAFPTVVLLDSEQRPYAFTGFRDEGPNEYLTHLTELQTARKTRDEFMKQANNETGTKRAELLDQALSALDANIVEVYYSDLVEEIGQLDSDDEIGLRTKYFAQRDREIRKAVMSNISMVARLREPQDAVAFIDETLAEHQLPVEMLLVANNTKLRLLRQMEDVDSANQLSDQMIEMEGLDGETRQRLVVNKAFYLASLKKQDEALAELDKFIGSSPDNLLLTIAKGELFDSLGQYEDAIKSYDKAIMASASQPSVLIEVVGAKADAQYELDLAEQAVATLDSVVDNESIPGKLRAEVLLHKAMLLREQGRRRAAILAENKAVEIVEDVNEKAEIQKLVDQFRRKFDTSDGNQ